MWTALERHTPGGSLVGMICPKATHPRSLAWTQAAPFLRGPETRKGGTALAPGKASAPVAKEHEVASGCTSGNGECHPFWQE